MSKHYYTRDELLEKARQKREKRLGIESEEKPDQTKQKQTAHPKIDNPVKNDDKIIKTCKGYSIKVDCFENCEEFAQTVSYTEEQRQAQNEAVERNRYKNIVQVEQ